MTVIKENLKRIWDCLVTKAAERLDDIRQAVRERIAKHKGSNHSGSRLREVDP